MDKNRTLAEFKKNAEAVVRVSFTTFKGRELIDLRVYYNAAQDGPDEWRPSPKGLTLRRELIPELKQAVDLAFQEWERSLPGAGKEMKDKEEVSSKD
jgi:hypothetical protein